MARAALDRTNHRYGRLLVLRRADNHPDGRVMWTCRCDCGKEKEIAANALGRGNTNSCGCLVHDGPRKAMFKDRTGEVFGRLTLIRPTGRRTTQGTAIWLCRCECGNMKEAASNNLVNGNVRSCGCFYRDSRGSNRSHGMSETRIYKIWGGMKHRCQDPNSPRYPDYGGRGITVCDRWQTFENFYADMGERPTKGLTLERLDNDGPYAPGNVVWGTDAEQRANKRKRIVRLRDMPKPGEVCRLCGHRRETENSPAV